MTISYCKKTQKQNISAKNVEKSCISPLIFFPVTFVLQFSGWSSSPFLNHLSNLPCKAKFDKGISSPWHFLLILIVSSSKEHSQLPLIGWYMEFVALPSTSWDVFHVWSNRIKMIWSSFCHHETLLPFPRVPLHNIAWWKTMLLFRRKLASCWYSMHSLCEIHKKTLDFPYTFWLYLTHIMAIMFLQYYVFIIK